MDFYSLLVLLIDFYSFFFFFKKKDLPILKSVECQKDISALIHIQIKNTALDENTPHRCFRLGKALVCGRINIIILNRHFTTM